MIRVALTEKRRIDVESYIFPEDYYDIPDLKGFQDVEAVEKCAELKLAAYAGGFVDLYLNGGMAIETLACVQAAGRLHIHLNILHHDKIQDQYVAQEIRWRPRTVSMDQESVEIFGLCRGRHAGLGKRMIYEAIPDERIFDYVWLEQRAAEALKAHRGRSVKVCISGLSSAYLSVLNVAADLGIRIIWLHYDYSTENYFLQQIDR